MEDIDYGWGVGSVVAMLVAVACLFFFPLVIGALTPPPIYIFFFVAIFLAAIFIFMSNASS
ncbi:hypothetical protein DCAR_0728787 [Daucus carota subsp. sativus]|uniref:Transmembrane protein n=1 Tax=Daucus carota subsp. sativus TaxID=79200 RepID=A0AAF0XJM3_DAUCS|nr:hypothetical protein DCAR_0728787 [Daucus carota subsp. sativus]